jgi:leader peptidase (prepilin peptidase)/N-methyltransferase
VILLPLQMLLATLAGLGLLVGSFLNVVIHRVPAGLSLLRPGSACPTCQRPVRPYDNVPVVSWLLLRGRCRDCNAPIAGRYPLVEAVTGLLFLAAGARFGWTPYLFVALVLLAAGTALFVIDLEHRRLPFAITGFTAAVTVLALGLDALFGDARPVPVAVLSAALWLALYSGVWFLTAGRGMGLGDVALAPVLGLTLGWLGWGASLVGLVGGFVIGALVGLLLIATGRVSRRSPVPHGPFMLAGAGLGMFAGQPVWHTYLQLVQLA